MSLQVKFGKKLKKIRETLRLSQEEFSEKIGLHRNSLVRIEYGKGFPSVKTLERIHEIFQIPYNELFDFDEQIFKNSHRAILIALEELNEADVEYFLTTINAYIEAKNKNDK